MRNLPLAKKYAVAVFNLAPDRGRTRPALEDVERLAAVLASDRGALTFFEDPTVPVDDKHRILERFAPEMGLSQECVGLCKTMIANGRMVLFPDVAQEFRRMVDDFEGKTEAWVTAGRELLPAEQQRIQGVLSNLTQKTVSLNVNVDPSLIGGVIVRIGNTIIDGSVSGRLRAFAERTE